MAKKIKAVVKLVCKAGQANPAPPVGPALGQHGVNIVDFCQRFNQMTQGRPSDELIPVEITIFEDRTFNFKLKSPPASFLLKKAAGIEKGSSTPVKAQAGTVDRQQIREIAQTKMADLNAKSIEKAVKIIEGTAKSMGIGIKE